LTISPRRWCASQGESWSFALTLRLASFALLRSDGVDPVLILDDVSLNSTRAGGSAWSSCRSSADRGGRR